MVATSVGITAQVLASKGLLHIPEKPAEEMFRIGCFAVRYVTPFFRKNTVHAVLGFIQPAPYPLVQRRPLRSLV
jgi:hypothetical protein